MQGNLRSKSERLPEQASKLATSTLDPTDRVPLKATPQVLKYGLVQEQFRQAGGQLNQSCLGRATFRPNADALKSPSPDFRRSVGPICFQGCPEFPVAWRCTYRERTRCRNAQQRHVLEDSKVAFIATDPWSVGRMSKRVLPQGTEPSMSQRQG